jgi:uncharacterized membrane protein YqjE
MTPDDVDLRVEPRAPEKSLGELVADMTSSLSSIFRKEIELAKVELKEEASKAGKGAGMLGGAAIAGWLTLLMASFALVSLLDEVMHTALAFLLVAVLYGIGAFVLQAKGREQLAATPVLPETKRSLQEDAEWARTQRS